jgi:hypothetical protein
MLAQMKTIIILRLLVFGIIILIPSCRKADPVDENNPIIPPVKPPDTINLIKNSSFEINGEKSLAGWEIFCPDIGFINYVPPGGGNWAICMSPGWIPSFYFIMTTVPAPIGKNEYRLSYYVMTRGLIELYIKKEDSLLFCKRIYTQNQDTIWRYYSILDTLTTKPGDSLTVKVVSGSGEVGPLCNFDLCKLELIK